MVEVGYRADGAGSTTQTATLRYGGTGTDLAQGGTDAATAPGWIEFSGADALFTAPPAISYVGKGAESLVANNTANAPGLPAGLQAGDLLVLLHGMTSWSNTANEPGTPAGWTRKATTVSTNGHNRLTWYYRRYQAGDTAPTLTYAGTTSDIRFAQIYAFRNVIDTGDPTDVLGAASTNTAQANMGPITGITTTVAGGVVLVAGVREMDWAAGGGLTPLSGDGLTWVEICDREDWALNPGDNIGVGLNYTLTPNSLTVASKTFTVNTGNTAPAVGQMWALKPMGTTPSTANTGGFFAVF